MRIAFRVDASRVIGTGHVRRCLALAQALRALGAECLFVARDLGLDVTTMVQAEGFPTTVLTPPSGSLPSAASPHADWAGVDAMQDASETAEVVGAVDWVVVDHYAFDAIWHDAVRRATGAKIAVLNDLADRRLAADLIVDHNFHPDHRRKYAGVAEATRMLVGPRFALLGPAYADAPRYSFNPIVESIGVFMGGVDAANASARVIEAIEQSGFRGQMEIVSTSANPHLDELRAAAAHRTAMRLTLDLDDLAAFFARHDLQIGAGGGATWERCCIGAPTLLLVAAENQRTVAVELAKSGVVAVTTPTDTLDPQAIAPAITELLAEPARRAHLSERSSALTDGLGARRVALCMMAPTMTVRPATQGDAGIMHAWRNDPVTRLASRQQAPIALGDHIAWLERALTNSASTLMIGMIGQIPVGVIRFDRLETNTAEVSLYLDPSLHGLGLGLPMLLAGEAGLEDGLDIVAEVLEGNVQSAGLFESARYTKSDRTHWIKSAASRMQVKKAK